MIDGGDAECGGVARAVDRNMLAFEPDLALIWEIDPGHDLNQSRLAGAVVTDESDHLARVDLEVDCRKCLDRPEPLAYPSKLKARLTVGGVWREALGPPACFSHKRTVALRDSSGGARCGVCRCADVRLGPEAVRDDGCLAVGLGDRDRGEKHRLDGRLPVVHGLAGVQCA